MQTLVRTFPCEVHELPTLRLTLEQWLLVNDIDVDARVAAVIAAHEAAANAIEHGHCNEIELEGRLEPEHTIYLEVRADGNWRLPSNSDDGRGRGLTLINGLMDSVSVDTHPDCTSVRMRRRFRPSTYEI